MLKNKVSVQTWKQFLEIIFQIFFIDHDPIVGLPLFDVFSIIITLILMTSLLCSVMFVNGYLHPKIYTNPYSTTLSKMPSSNIVVVKTWAQFRKSFF